MSSSMSSGSRTLLSSVLLSVHDALPQSCPSALCSAYRAAIQSQAEALDALPIPSVGGPTIDCASVACEAGKIMFDAYVVTSGGDNYEEQQQANWSSTCWLPAAGFFKLQNSVEVALALRIVNYFQAIFSIRSAGHNANPGFSSIEGSGVVLDLSGLDEIVLSSGKDVVSVGPGATWDRVYEQLEEHELTVVGGRVDGVGVGGLLTGGGMSHFSNHWGMACDNVKNIEVILADATIVQANVNENADLFKALKGGGSNFGIATRFDLYLRLDHKVWYTVRVYSAEHSHEVMRAAVDVQKAMDEDDHIGFFLSVNSGFLVAGLLYKGWSEETSSSFRAFDSIPIMNVAVPETNGTQLSASHASSMNNKAKREIGTAAIRANADLYIDLHKALQSIVKTQTPSLVFTIQPLGQSAVKKGLENGGNWLAIATEWTDDAEDELARKQLRELISAIEITARARRSLLKFQFMNDASYIQSPLKSYGFEMLEFLRSTSRKWDSKRLFQRQQNSGFLLSKVA